MVAALMNEPDPASFYFSLSASDRNLRDFIHHARRVLSAQSPPFGRHLNLLSRAALEEPGAHLDQVVCAFAREICDLRKDEFYLILDDFDHINSAEDKLDFIERLARRLPHRCKLILNGRELPRLPWLPIFARGDAVIIDERGWTLRGVVPRREMAEAEWRMHALGPGFAFRDDQLVHDWDGNLPRLLLCAAMEGPGVTRNQLCRLLWRGLDLEQAVNVFHVTKRRLHKALGVDVLHHSGEAYHISDAHPVYYDACEFVSAIMAARYGDKSSALENWGRAVDLYRGPFLQSHDDWWIIDRRAAFQSAYIEALLNIAAIHEAREKHELALPKLLRAIETDYADERLHQKALRLYLRLGRRPEAVVHFRNYEAWAADNERQLSQNMQALSREIVA